METAFEKLDGRGGAFRWRRSFAISGLAWLAFSGLNASQVYMSMLDHGHSYPRMLFFNLAAWGVWALMTPFVLYLGRRWPLIPFRLGAFCRHLLAALVTAAIHTAAWTRLTISIRPYDEMTAVELEGNFARPRPVPGARFELGPSGARRSVRACIIGWHPGRAAIRRRRPRLSAGRGWKRRRPG